MPPCNIRCNIISNDGKKKLTKAEFQPYLPATFTVPVKEVYAILGMSRHTLAPMRLKWGSRWPFLDVCKGSFGPMSWTEIEEFRHAAIVDERTDPRIVTILKIMEEQSCKHKHKLDKRLEAIRQQGRLVPAEVTAPSSTVVMGFADLSVPDGLLPDDEEYWTGLSELLLIHLNAQPGELFPPVEL